MNKKQTAVEWLVQKIWKTEPLEHEKQVIDQAKAMQRQQMSDSWDNAAIDATYGNKYKNFDQYFTETYGTK